MTLALFTEDPSPCVLGPLLGSPLSIRHAAPLRPSDLASIVDRYEMGRTRAWGVIQENDRVAAANPNRSREEDDAYCDVLSEVLAEVSGPAKEIIDWLRRRFPGDGAAAVLVGRKFYCAAREDGMLYPALEGPMEGTRDVLLVIDMDAVAGR